MASAHPINVSDFCKRLNGIDKFSDTVVGSRSSGSESHLAIAYQVFNGEDRHGVLFGKRHYLWQAGHGAIRVGHFAENTGWLQSGQSHKIHRTLGMTASGQHAAGLGA
jgi:hypothetical protein